MNWLRRLFRSIWPRHDRAIVTLRPVSDKEYKVYDRHGRLVADPNEQAALLDEMYGKRAQIYGADGSIVADSRKVNE